MCLIINRDAGIVLDKDKFTTAVDNNPDGWGLTVPMGNGKLQVLKSMDSDPDYLYNLLHKEYKDEQVMVHLRWNTAGETSLRNAHPFPILEYEKDGVDLRMTHNGTLHKYKPASNANNKWESDTRVFVREFVRPLFKRVIKAFGPELILNDDFTYDLLHEKMGSSSVLSFMDGFGNELQVNSEGNGGFFDEDNTFFSNKYSFNKTHRNTGSSVVGFTGKASTKKLKPTTNITTDPIFSSTRQKKFSEEFCLESLDEFNLLSDYSIDLLIKDEPESAGLLIKELIYELYKSEKKVKGLEEKLKGKI